MSGGYFVQGTEELINSFQVGTTNILGSVCRHIGFYGYGEIVPVLIKQQNLHQRSVGKPKDGDIRACVTLVDISEGDVKTEFVRAPYDIEKTASAIIESGLPAYFVGKLREGK